VTLIEIGWAAWGGVASLAWIVYLLRSLYEGARLPQLARRPPPEPSRWPSLAVVVPARDEAGPLREALATLCAQDYPNLEIVVVDDRSEDGTGRVADEAEASDPRVRSLHVAQLPEGWLGKVHALHVGAAAVPRAEWVLFTDADVHFAAGALRRAVAFAVDKRLDHLTVAPALRSDSVWQEAVTLAFGTSFLQTLRPSRLTKPGSKAFAGIGAFNLVRRELFDLTPGFRWLRLEVLDDVGLGLMIKRAGARSAMAIGHGLVEVRWYASLRAMVRGLEKNLFAGVGRFSLPRALALTVLLLAAHAGPLLALAHPLDAVRGLGLAALAGVPVFAVAIRAGGGARLRAGLLHPFGGLVLAWALARSALVCWHRGGVTWRGTTYPIETLARGQRVRL
jgi:cellulose synthase/poly-beta-1,6-N-acetylglucosamine synthase-like glycosyltransferase